MGFGCWLRDHPRLLEWAYGLTQRFFQWTDPLIGRLGYDRVERWIQPVEDISKKAIFDCRVCGQCVLHSTGMTCPKNLRNGLCEVIPEMRCAWVEAFERSRKMAVYGEEMIHPTYPLTHPPFTHHTLYS